MKQIESSPPMTDLMTRVTNVLTETYQQDYNRNKKIMEIKRTGEQIDAHLGIKFLYVTELDADRLKTGDILVYDRWRWEISGSSRSACGFVFFPIQQIEKWRGTPSWSGRGK